MDSVSPMKSNASFIIGMTVCFGILGALIGLILVPVVRTYLPVAHFGIFGAFMGLVAGAISCLDERAIARKKN